MKDILDGLLKEAVAQGWEIEPVEFVMNPLTFWTQMAGIVQFKLVEERTLFGMRGVFKFEDREIPVCVNAYYKENMICLHKDRTKSIKALTFHLKNHE